MVTRAAAAAGASAANAAAAAAEAERRRADGKACSDCRMVLPLEMFTPAPRNADGREGTCKQCRARARRRADQLRAHAAAVREAARGIAAFVMPWCCRACSGPLIWSTRRDWWELAHEPDCKRPWQLYGPDEQRPLGSTVLECEQCGEEFTLQASGQRFCSVECRNAAHSARWTYAKRSAKSDYDRQRYAAGKRRARTAQEGSAAAVG